MDTPQELFERYHRLVGRAATAVADVRLDIADEAERLANDVAQVFQYRPLDDATSVIRLIGESAVNIANTARSRF